MQANSLKNLIILVVFTVVSILSIILFMLGFFTRYSGFLSLYIVPIVVFGLLRILWVKRVLKSGRQRYVFALFAIELCLLLGFSGLSAFQIARALDYGTVVEQDPTAHTLSLSMMAVSFLATYISRVLLKRTTSVTPQ